MKTLIRNARLISPEWEITGGSLLVEDGEIRSIHHPGGYPAADVIHDAESRIVIPGFIDIHSHGADGADVCDGTVESILHIAETKLREGVTTWLPTTLTQPAGRLREIAEACRDAMMSREFCRMPGIHLEGPFINRAKAGAQNPEYVRPPDSAEVAALHGIVPIKVMSVAPEMPGALDVIRAASAMGIICSAAHTAATFPEIEGAKDAGLRHLTHYGNAMTPLHHREIGVIGAGLLDDGLMIELICDGVHLSPDMLRLVFKCVPIGRIMMITDSVAASWRPDGPMNLGGLQTEIEGGVVRLKTGELAGSTLKSNEGLGIAARVSGLPLERLVAATSWNQARSLGLAGFGKLEPGHAADFVILEKDFSVRETWVGGVRRFQR